METQRNMPPNEIKGEIPRKRTKWNGGKQSVRYRVQNDGYKNAQETLGKNKWTQENFNKKIVSIKKDKKPLKTTS